MAAARWPIPAVSVTILTFRLGIRGATRRDALVADRTIIPMQPGRISNRGDELPDRRDQDSRTWRHAGTDRSKSTIITIAEAKAIVAARSKPFHESEDSILLAYQWLDAQTRARKPATKFRPLKHIIENWGGRYVSRSDVEVAALMHPEIRGSYGFYNIGSRLTRPSDARLVSIASARTQGYRLKECDYPRKEAEGNPRSPKGG